MCVCGGGKGNDSFCIIGRDEQGMSTALSVEKLGKNAGLIINESQGISYLLSLLVQFQALLQVFHLLPQVLPWACNQSI